jgi:hypothetical protein
MSATSQQSPGSARAQVAIVSPESSSVSTPSCCAGVPASDNAAATMFTGRNGPGAQARPSSSATSAASAIGCPDKEPPPAASDTSIDVHPSSAA